jgi:hypothetical protein
MLHCSFLSGRQFLRAANSSRIAIFSAGRSRAGGVCLADRFDVEHLLSFGFGMRCTGFPREAKKRFCSLTLLLS